MADGSGVPGPSERPRWTRDAVPRAIAIGAALAILVVVAVVYRGAQPLSGPGFVSESSLEPHATLRTSLGDIEVALYEQLVPLTVDRFVDLAQAGHYNGTTVDRIVKGYDVQMGDPASGGHPAPDPIPDEFHPALRHEGQGVVSMATSGPDTGVGQFFITTATIHSYDDRYSVFGHVVRGMDVVQAIEALPIQGTGTYGPPQQAVQLLGVTVEPASPSPAAVRHGAALATLDAGKAASVEAGATFAVVVTNKGTVRDILALNATAPDGWTAAFENPRVALPAGRSWVVLLTVTPLDAAAPPATVGVHAHSETQPRRTAVTSVQATVGQFGSTPQPGTTVTVEYTGVLTDGRVFDTTDPLLAASADHSKVSSYFSRQTFQPYEFTLGGGAVVPGFDSLVARTRLGETSVGQVAWTAGYDDGSVLAHRDLVFEVTIVSAYA